MTHLTAAVHLDRMLANLTDEAAEAFARSAEERHPGLGDQLDAATHEADTVARHLGDIQTEHRARSSIPAWLRIPALTELVSWGAGDSRTCRHAPSPLRPQPVMAAAHRPGLVSCLECAPALLRAHGEEDRRCDGCQRIPQITEPVAADLGHLTPHELRHTAASLAGFRAARILAPDEQDDAHDEALAEQLADEQQARARLTAVPQ